MMIEKVLHEMRYLPVTALVNIILAKICMFIESKTKQVQHCALVVMLREFCPRLWNSSLKLDRFDVGYDEK